MRHTPKFVPTIGTSRRIKMKFIAALLSVLLIIPAIPFTASAKTIEEVQAEQAQLKAEKEQLEADLADLENNEAEAQAYHETLEKKITLVQERIDTTRQNITDLNNSITDLEQKLEDSAIEYDDTMEQLKERIKVLYQMGDVGTLEILLNSTSLYNFSLRTETLKSVTEHDKELMDQIRDYMERTEADRKSLQEQKEEVARLQVSLESDQEELLSDQAKNQELIAQLQEQQSEKQAAISEKEEEDAALNAELEKLIADKKAAEEAAAAAGGGSGGSSGGESDGNTVYVPPTGGGGGGLGAIWPLPGYSANDITQYYGNNGHNGMDIGVPYGTPIVAAASGEVLNASYHWSWGNNVLLYHNGTYSTRYAHMSSMAVSVGQYVSQGQVIGYVGNTGNSFGDHLHFEVYLDGYRVDPYPYLFG